MKKETKQDYLDNTLERECLQTQYKSDFGGYRPHFEGRPPGQLPNTWKTYVAVILLLFPCWILSTGLFAACLAWATREPDSFCWANLALLIATVCFIIILSYIGSIDRRKREKDYIDLKEKQLEEIKKILKAEQDAADNLLLSAQRS